MFLEITTFGMWLFTGLGLLVLFLFILIAKKM